MTKFRYLDNPAYAEYWVKGGPQPLRLNSYYIGLERSGILTPDEGRVLLAQNATAEQLALMRDHLLKGPVRLHARTVRLPGGSTIENFHSDWASGLVLCFSNQRNDERWREEGKRVCVAVDFPRELFRSLSEQIPSYTADNHAGNRERRCGVCQYTKTGQLDVFTKNESESWQDEFRMYWPSNKELAVALPPKSGRIVWEA
jgi:hypothetical protein